MADDPQDLELRRLEAATSSLEPAAALTDAVLASLPADLEAAGGDLGGLTEATRDLEPTPTIVDAVLAALPPEARTHRPRLRIARAALALGALAAASALFLAVQAERELDGDLAVVDTWGLSE